eukprot:CAMPEP_0171951634 /NCGR_PEP_ID=MMETSP0993-20121228/85240_1 /TAXON_ID=483369 /ORGANISM="non described non described, Strain CCMP2098" /LENGTH=51 /DNA_ID=CAMNT_0012596813 /DNA_START=38 /DNA_END=193 /DNA_ORIENTATION=+
MRRPRFVGTVVVQSSVVLAQAGKEGGLPTPKVVVQVQQESEQGPLARRPMA